MNSENGSVSFIVLNKFLGIDTVKPELAVNLKVNQNKIKCKLISDTSGIT